ncbi:hypothetical protein H6G76_30710 [Nostoc sp. FACHB-152]|nr:hypothetical protein [Nostoc sp. FACHB-152]
MRRKTPSSQIYAKLRHKEGELINNLAKSKDTGGIIGIQARAALKRLPSNIYWYGLGAWGIRHFPGSQDEYHRSLDHLYSSTSCTLRDDDGEPVKGKITNYWHQGIPSSPPDFPENANFWLTLNEADYLAERIITQQPNSLLAFLVNRRQQFFSVDFVWEHPLYDEFPTHIQQQLHHARNFSETIQGAALLYNLMLAEQKTAETLIEEYQQKLRHWADRLAKRQKYLRDWDWQKLPEIVAVNGVTISYLTQNFIKRWLNFALKTEVAQTIATHQEARRLIQEREIALKGSQARLSNPRALELWNGGSGIAQLDYRWGTTQKILGDILSAFAEETDDVTA